MKLHVIPGACSLSPHIVVHELGLDVDLVKIDYSVHRTDDGRDFRALNPFGYVPLLELDDGTTFREGPAILHYLANLRPEAGLVPDQGAIDWYRHEEWLSFLTSEIHKGFVPLFHARFGRRDMDEAARSKLGERYAWLDRHLAGRAYLMGDMFTVADAYLYALTQWGRAAWLEQTYGVDVRYDGLDNLKAWYLRMRARPGVRKALNAEGLK